MVDRRPLFIKSRVDLDYGEVPSFYERRKSMEMMFQLLFIHWLLKRRANWMEEVARSCVKWRDKT